MLTKTYLDMNVLEAAIARVRFVFDHFEHICVSVSGGKDSTVLFHLCLEEARRRGRKIHVFFLDQEAEYQATVDLMRLMMADPAVLCWWHQVPLLMTNATSYLQDQLYAWGEGEPWIRDKEPGAVQAIAAAHPRRFYPFFEWFEATRPGAWAFFVGLRAEEGINRFRAVTRHPGFRDVMWSSRTKSPISYKFYPLYDWGMGDVWRFILERAVPYNRIYDLKWALNKGIYNKMRVSNLIHEKSFWCLGELPQLEPETYAKLVRRLQGVHCAANHAEDDYLYAARSLPPRFLTWKDYRDWLLEALPVSAKKRGRFKKRFAGPGDEDVYQAQVKRLLLNDWEGSVPITTVAKDDKPDKFARWKRLF